MLEPRRIPELCIGLCSATKNDNTNRCASLMVPPSSNSVYSEPRRTPDLLYAERPIRAESTTRKGHILKPTPQRMNSGKQLSYALDKDKCFERTRRNLFGAERSAIMPQKDKQWLQQKTERIEAHLKQAGIFQSLLQRGLHQMSTKDFVSIANYFMRCAGIEKSKLAKNFDIDYIVKVLQQLGYTAKINKSWLLTPGAQHAYGHVLSLLDFFVDFSPQVDLPFEFEQNEFLFTMAVECYAMWQGNKMEQDQLKRNMCNLIVQESCGLNDMQALQVHIANMQQQVLDLKTRSTDGLENYQQQLQRLIIEATSLESVLADCKQQLAPLSVNIAGNEKLLGQRATELWRQGRLLKELRQQVGQQVCSKEEYESLLETCAGQKDELQLRRHERQELSERSQLQKLQLRRTRKDLTTSIEAFNAHMRDLLYSSVWKVDSSVQLELPLSPTFEQVAQRRQMLEQLHNNMTLQQQQMQQRTVDLQQRLNEIALNGVQLNNSSEMEKKKELMQNQKLLCMRQKSLQAERAGLKRNVIALQQNHNELLRELELQKMQHPKSDEENQSN